MASQPRTMSWLISCLPIFFVILWSSAFISAKAILADSSAFASLSLRFAIVCFGFAAAYLFIKTKKWLTWREMQHAATTGILMHGIYLGGVFWALSHGMSATVAALIASLQPVLVALLARPLLAEKITVKQWFGIICGFCGAVFVIGWDIGGAIPISALVVCIGALIASVAGTFYQKRYGQDLPLIPANITQAFAATCLHLVLLYFLEVPFIHVTTSYILGMAWQILAVSFGAYVMLLILLQRGTANQTSSLLFLIAPVAAVQAWLVLGEQMTAIDVLGLCLASFGVYLATRKNHTSA